VSILLNNKLLQATEAQIEANLTGQTKEDYLKIVVAGQRYALHGGKDGLLASLKNQPNPIRDCVRGAVNIVGHLKMLARGTMPVQAMVPAAMSLMLQGLDFLDRSKTKPIGKEELVLATRLFIDDICKLMNVTPQVLARLASQTQSVLKDGGKVEMMKREVGAVSAPNASRDTEMPPPPPPNRRARRAAARGRV
jgi:hypothetical protein